METSGKKPLGHLQYGRVRFLTFVSLLCVLSGIIGERLPIRYYLTTGMLASGAFTALFGLGYFYNIHSLGFYVVTQVRPGSVAQHKRVSLMSRTGLSYPCPGCQ